MYPLKRRAQNFNKSKHHDPLDQNVCYAWNHYSSRSYGWKIVNATNKSTCKMTFTDSVSQVTGIASFEKGNGFVVLIYKRTVRLQERQRQDNWSSWCRSMILINLTVATIRAIIPSSLEKCLWWWQRLLAPQVADLSPSIVRLSSWSDMPSSPRPDQIVLASLHRVDHIPARGLTTAWPLTHLFDRSVQCSGCSSFDSVI